MMSLYWTNKITIYVCLRGRYLEVLPLSVLVPLTVRDDDGGIIRSSGQALVVLHQLVRFIDTEQLPNTQTNTCSDTDHGCRC